MGESDSEVGVDNVDANHVLTEGSSSARRQRSTRGNKDIVGSAVAITSVVWLHAFNTAGVAEIGLAGGGVEKRVLRYGPTTPVKICLACAFDWPVFFQTGAESIKEDSFERTVSREGTCVNSMGSRERASTAGRDIDVCGCAVVNR